MSHYADRPRHTMQVDWYLYEHEIRTKELPAGRERSRLGMAPTLAGRTERQEPVTA